MVTESSAHSSREGDGSRAANPDLGAALRVLLDGVGDWAAAAAAGASEAAGTHQPGATGSSSGAGSTGVGSASGAGFAGGPQGWTATGGSTAGAGGTHTISTCGVCPICLGLAALSRSHPEVLAHLSDAAQSVLAAVAAMAQPQGARSDRSERSDGDAWAARDSSEPDEQRIDVSE